MADDPHNTSDMTDNGSVVGTREDAETTAARRELKQTSISDKDKQDGRSDNSSPDGSDTDTSLLDKPASSQPASPEDETVMADAHHRDLRDKISSPKKKRVYDELDEPKDMSLAARDDDGASTKSGDTNPTKSRTDRSEPEKKRPRDRGSARSSDVDDEAVTSPSPFSPARSRPRPFASTPPPTFLASPH